LDVRQPYTTVEDVKKNIFLYIEYGALAHIKKIIFSHFFVFFDIYFYASNY